MRSPAIIVAVDGASPLDTREAGREDVHYDGCIDRDMDGWIDRQMHR